MDRTIFSSKLNYSSQKKTLYTIKDHIQENYPSPLSPSSTLQKYTKQVNSPSPLPFPTLLKHTKYAVKRQVTHYLRITNLHKFYCLRREHNPQGRNNEKIQKSFDKNESKLEEQQHIHRYLNNEQKDSVQYITE